MMADGVRRLRDCAILYLLSSIFALTLAGCSAAGILAYKLAGPAAVPAKYVPAKTPILVLVENRSEPSATVGPEVLTAYLLEDLEAAKVGPLIPLEKLEALRDSQKPGEFVKMSISAIGKAVGASQVMYVQFDRDDVTPLSGGESLQGKSLVRVRMVDVASGETLWPKDQTDGYAVSGSTTLGAATSDGTTEAVHRRIYGELSTEIGKLFHEWTPEEDQPPEF